MRTDTSVLLRPPACIGRQNCPHVNGGRSRSTRAARRPLRVYAVGWVSHIARKTATIAPLSNHVFNFIELWSAVSKSGGTYLQDPEGILATPKGGHISRRTFQKQLAEDKTLLEQVEKEREAAREELQARRDVSACPQYRGSACALPQHMPQPGTVMYLLTYDADSSSSVQARKQPQSHAELVEYLLCTEQLEMEYETARCRPLMTQDFFGFLQEDIGAHLLL